MRRVLIDTQALIWFAEDALALSKRAVALVDEPLTMRFASAASIWEMAIKIALGKLKITTGTLRQFVDKLVLNDIQIVPVLAEDAIELGNLRSGEHKDRFDRIIAAQCLRQNFTLISIDAIFDDYGVTRVW